MTTVYARSDFESDLTSTKVQSDRTMSPSMIRSLGLLVVHVCFISRKCVRARGCQIAKVQPGLLCGRLACDWWGVQSTSIHPSVDFGLFKLSNFAQHQSSPEWEDWTKTFFLIFYIVQNKLRIVQTLCHIYGSVPAGCLLCTHLWHFSLRWHFNVSNRQGHQIWLFLHQLAISPFDIVRARLILMSLSLPPVVIWTPEE